MKEPKVENLESCLNVVLPTKHLMNALNILVPIIEKRNVISVLSCVRISAKANLLEMTVTNETVLAQLKIGADIRKEDEIAIDVITFLDVVRKLPQDHEVSLQLKDNQLVITSGKCNFGLNIISPEKFPVISEISNPTSAFELSTQDLLDLVKYTEFAMLTNETRYNLNGIALHTVGSGSIKKIASAATDGHRLSNVETQQGLECDSFSVLLPAKLAHNILRVFSDQMFAGKQISVKVDPNKIGFSVDNFHLVSKLVNATFPEYQNLIPRNNKKIVKIQSKLLSETINRVTTVSTEKFRAIKLNISKESLEISAYSETKGRAQETILASDEEGKLYSYNAEDIKIAFNSKYLQDILNESKGSVLTIYLDTDIGSVLIYADKIKNATFVVMPVKI